MGGHGVGTELIGTYQIGGGNDHVPVVAPCERYRECFVGLCINWNMRKCWHTAAGTGVGHANTDRENLDA